MARIALLQMTSGIDPSANFAVLAEAAATAWEAGAQILFTPEMSLLLDRDRTRSNAHIVTQAASPYISRLQGLADELSLHIALGSMAVFRSGGRLANRSLFFAPDQEQPDAYDKIHMFDVDLPDGESWRESAAYAPGDTVVTIDSTPVSRLGLTVCYDLRFPALFDALGMRACDVIAVPAAFTFPTGQAHWHVLLRARAIEASAYIVAAAQVGLHEDGRRTYGHSLVVDPWGEVLLDMGGEEPGLAFAEIDFGRIDEVRRQLPSLANRRTIAK